MVFEHQQWQLTHEKWWLDNQKYWFDNGLTIKDGDLTIKNGGFTVFTHQIYVFFKGILRGFPVLLIRHIAILCYITNIKNCDATHNNGGIRGM